MLAARFSYDPNPQVLQWLSSGQLTSRLQRSLRLWVLLQRLYGHNEPWCEQLGSPFTYAVLRDRLFSATHPTSEVLEIREIRKRCQDPRCLCHKSLRFWLEEGQQPLNEWVEEISKITSLSKIEVERHLQQFPFATVHRTLREDLKQLVQLRWMENLGRGQYRCLNANQLPTPTLQTSSGLSGGIFTLQQTKDLYHLLRSVDVLQPSLSPVMDLLWEQVIGGKTSSQWEEEPQQRIFVDLGYILSEEDRERVDDYQDELQRFWQTSAGGVVQFDYWVMELNDKIQTTVYPVCLHYVRRAKYLSAFGKDPFGKFGWHNYRLDRIFSPRLTILTWGDPQVPYQLQGMWRQGELPTPSQVEQQLEEAWGFNFYLPRTWLLLRFPLKFAQGYVDNTYRHTTFKPIEYARIPSRLKSLSVAEQQNIHHILQQRSPNDAYYQAWIRQGDINLIHRLREWRPNAEVLSPWSLRQQMAAEALEELLHYP